MAAPRTPKSRIPGPRSSRVETGGGDMSKLRDLVDSALEECLCRICGDIMNDPIMPCKRGHRFCRPCIAAKPGNLMFTPCPVTGCGNHLSQDWIRGMLADDLVSKVTRMLYIDLKTAATPRRSLDVALPPARPYRNQETQTTPIIPATVPSPSPSSSSSPTPSPAPFPSLSSVTEVPQRLRPKASVPIWPVDADKRPKVAWFESVDLKKRGTSSATVMATARETAEVAEEEDEDEEEEGGEAGAPAPEGGAPEDGAPEDGAPEDGAPEDGSPEERAPEEEDASITPNTLRQAGWRRTGALGVGSSRESMTGGSVVFIYALLCLLLGEVARGVGQVTWINRIYG